MGKGERAKRVLAGSGEEDEVNKKAISLMTGEPCTPSEASNLFDIEFSLEKSPPWCSKIDVYMRGSNMHLSLDKKFYVTELVLSEADETGFVNGGFPKPAFSVSFGSAQSLMDQLWACGVCPTEKTLPSADTLQATKDHLADMREIAFARLGAGDE